MKLGDLHPRRFFLDVWHEIDAEAAELRSSSDRKDTAKDAMLAMYVFAVVAISLILQEYYGDRYAFGKILEFVDNPLSKEASPFLYSLVGWLAPGGKSLSDSLAFGGYYELWILGYWAAWRVVGFVAIPAVAVAVHPRLRFRELGLGAKGMMEHAWLYAVLFIPVLAAVIAVSYTKEFSSYYPFYANAHRSLLDFAAWEALYIAQFLALEFFFRGFMIQPLRRFMGSSVIFAMTIPYCMIHFGKPILECFASVIAGIVLGTLALRTRSIWLGFAIHASVALSMDLMAIWQVHS